MKTVIITGGAGFIGSHLCKKLINNNYKVICIDNLLTGLIDNIQNLTKHPNFKFINYDVTRPLSNIANEIDYIYHLASPASPNHHSKISYHALPYQTMMVNTTGTDNLLKLAIKFQARFLFTSSSEVYGNPKKHPQDETYSGNVSTIGPRSVYDESKRFGETLCAFYHRQYNLDIRIARIFNTYGPYMRIDDKRMIINFITQALDNKPITIYGNGKQTRSLCYIDDMVSGLVAFMDKEGLNGEIINLGSSNELSVLEYAKTIIKLTKSKSKIVFSEKLPSDDPTRRKPEITKAKKLLGWQPKTSLIQGLQKIILFFKNKNNL